MMQNVTKASARRWLAGLVLLFIGVSGCGSNSPMNGTYSVSGKVTRCVGIGSGCIRSERNMGQWRLGKCGQGRCELSMVQPLSSKWGQSPVLVYGGGHWTASALRLRQLSFGCRGEIRATYDNFDLVQEPGTGTAVRLRGVLVVSPLSENGYAARVDGRQVKADQGGGPAQTEGGCKGFEQVTELTLTKVSQ